jgi:cytochrome c-type biogenesis protein
MTLSLATIFSAGLLTFLTPCILPLVPIYLATLAGGDVRAIGMIGRAQLLTRALLFSIGFVAVFTLMGIGASGIGRALVSHKTAVQTLGGVLILLFGLKFLGFVQMPWLDRVLRVDDGQRGKPVTALGSLLMGVLFAAAWSPCVGPILGSVLTYTAAATTSPAVGAAYLATYGAGVALPLLITAAFAEAGLGMLKRLRRGLPTFERALGALLVAASVTMLFGTSLLPDLGAPVLASQPAAFASKLPAPAVSPTAFAGPTMVELYSKDCPICQSMKPIVAAVTDHCEGKGVHFEAVDVSAAENRNLIDAYRLVGVPTFVFLGADGTEVARLIGRQSQDDLFQALAAVRGESCPGVGALPAHETSPMPREPVDSPSPMERQSCQSMNSSANTAASASTSNASLPSAANLPPARAAAGRESACSLASP